MDIKIIKKQIGRQIFNSQLINIENISLNEISDDILSNYLSYLINIKNGEKNIEDFLFFINNWGNLNTNIKELLESNRIILNPLININLGEKLKDPYELAKIYEDIKSTIIIISKKQIKIDESLDFRKSVGMFYTPRHIVRYIVKNATSKIKSKIIRLMKNKEYETAIDYFLGLRFSDIACGTGSFLIEMISFLNEIRDLMIEEITSDFNNESFEKIIKDSKKYLRYIADKCIFGVDIDKNAALLCSFNILSFCGLNVEDIKIYEKSVKVGDSLTGNIYTQKISINPKYKEFYDKGIKWFKDFPEVFSRNNPGFDLIAINPPYGKVRLESFKGHNKNKEITKAEREKIKLLSQFYRKIGFYKDSIYGVLNFYKIMVERAYNLLRKDGSIGFIVPNTLLNDLSTVKMRKHLFNKMQTEYIVEIPESADFFNQITQSFCIFIAFNGGTTNTLKIKRKVNILEDLDNKKYIKMELNFIRKIFPNLLNLPDTDELGLEILRKIYSYPKLSDFKSIINSRGEVDLSKFSKLISNNNEHKKLIRGNNIEFYHLNNDINSKLSYINDIEFKKLLCNSSKLLDIPKERIICKQIANQSKHKRMECTIVEPNSILANSCNYLTLKNGKENYLLRFLLGYMNSSLIEWRFRITSTNNHINNYEIDEFPLIIPQKSDPKFVIIEYISKLTEKIEEMGNEKDKQVILSKIDGYIFKLFGFGINEVKYLLKKIDLGENYIKLVEEFLENNNAKWKSEPGIYNHMNSKLSELDMKMVYSIPEGGNWKNIPEDIESERVQQIRKSGGRTTYYGRLRWDAPSFTISTYFTRVGNGTFIHPEQHRLISLREGARLQSFPDYFIFYGSRSSMYKQIGNAVPPLMAYKIGQLIKPKRFVDLFCGAGGFSLGLEMCGGRCEYAIDFKDYFCETFKKNHIIDEENVLTVDIKEIDMKDTFSILNNIDLVIGGPPCQGFSTAGNNLLFDPRNELVRYFIEAIEIIRPKYFIMENVKGLTFKKRRPFIDELYNRFNEAGYSIRHKILMAADYGVPQKRERVFFIGNRINAKAKFPKPLFSKEGIILPEYTTVKEAISDLPPLKMNDGIMERIPYPAEPKSEYQRLMRGLINYDEFVKKKKESTKGNKEYISLNRFF